MNAKNPDISRIDFQAEIKRLFHRYLRHTGPEQSFVDLLKSLYADCPEWMTAEKMHAAVTSICETEDSLPGNIMRAIKARCHRNPSDDLAGGVIECSPMEAARNRNRLKALLWLNGFEAGHDLRDKLVALEGAAMLKSAQGLDWRDGFNQRRYKPVLAMMEGYHKALTHAQACEAMEVVLDEAVARMERAQEPEKFMAMRQEQEVIG